MEIRKLSALVTGASGFIGLPVVVIRPTNVYGPYSNAWTIRPIKLIHSGQMILINGGAGINNFVYIDNLMEITSKFRGRPPKTTREAVRFLTLQTRFSNEKARRELGYQSRFSLEEGLKLNEQWLREAGYLSKVRKR